NFEDVAARLVAGLRVAVGVWLGERLPRLTGTNADAAGVLLSVAELREVDLRQRDRHEIVALFADHLTAADVFRKVAFHLPADQFAEPLEVLVNLLSHGDASGLEG